MDWWNDLTTSIGNVLTSTSEKDIAERNKQIRKVAAETQLGYGLSISEIDGTPIDNSIPVTYNNPKFDDALSLLNDIRSFNEKQEFFQNKSAEEQDAYLTRIADLYKLYYNHPLVDEDAEVFRKYNPYLPLPNYDRNGAIAIASERAARENGISQDKFLEPLKEEAAENSKRILDQMHQDWTQEEKQAIKEWEQRHPELNKKNDGGAITITDEPEYEPIKRQLYSGSEEQYFGNGKDILSAINDAYKIVTDEENIDKKTDYRVSLNVIPMNNLNNTYVTESEFNQRLGYVLGDSEGFLYKLYNKTAGLVFPYTPSITMNHSVNYEQTDISHSNLSIQNYQNTPPPSLSINADFTADTKENAIYMVGAIWFFRSLTKMDFGLRAQQPGMPPPVLYLNGWGALVNNIPVVISSFNVSLPKDKQYVSVQIGNTTQWVPTKITMEIGLKIQPNIEKYKQQFDLQGYKRGDFGGLSDVNIGNVFLEESTKFKKITDVYDNYEVDKNLNYKPIGTSTKSSLESEKAYNARKTSGAGWTW